MSGITRSNSSSSEQGVEFGRVDIPPISRISGALGDERIEEIEDKADSVLTLEGVPSEKESGVALNIAIISGVSFNGSGVVVGMIGTKVSGYRESRTEIGNFNVGCMNVGEILSIS
jgi:hypothetical protein